MINRLTLAVGLLAGLVSALIAASWQVVSRSASLTPLGPLELAILRYVIPSVLLLPVLFRIGLFPKGIETRVLFALFCGGGLPFGMLAFAGTRFAPAAHMGVMVAAMGPLITAGLLWLLSRERVSGLRQLGLILIASGVGLLSVRSLTAANQTWIGDCLFLLAACVWGCYGIAFRSSGLTAWQGAAIVNTWSAILLLPITLFVGVDGFSKVAIPTLALQAIWQGLIAGSFGLVAYTVAVQRLGASAAAAFGALVPVLSAVGGWLILAEEMTALVAVSSILAAAGVAMSVGLFDRNSKQTTTSELRSSVKSN